MNNDVSVGERHRAVARIFFVAKLLLLTALAYLFVDLGGRTSQPLKTPDAPWKVVSLELNSSTERASRIVASWDALEEERRKQSGSSSQPRLIDEHLYWDTRFICAYASLAAVACWISAEFLARNGRLKLRTGAYVMLAQIAAGACDYGENAAIHRMVTAPPVFPWPQLCFAFSLTKWLLISVGEALVLWSIFLWLVSLFRRSTPVSL